MANAVLRFPYKPKSLKELEARMKEAARRLDFEQAAELRDRVKALRKASLR